MRKPLRYLLLTFILFLFLFKPVTVFTLEVYLTSLLEAEVKVIDLHLFSLDLQASINDKDNIAHIKVNSLYPLQVDLVYKGNADAFKVYHPLKAQTSLRGSLDYKDAFIINAELLALGGKVNVKVKEEIDDWVVDANISHLDLEKLKDENNLSLMLSGEVNGEIDLHTEKDSNIMITSDSVLIGDDKFDNLKLQLSKAENKAYAWIVFDAKRLDYKGIWFNYDYDTNHFDGKLDLINRANGREMVIDFIGDHNDSTLMAEAGMQIADSHIYLQDLVYEFDTASTRANIDIDIKNLEKNVYILEMIGIDLQGDLFAKGNLVYREDALSIGLKSQSLGGDLDLYLVNDKISWSTKELKLKKLLHVFKVDEKLDAQIDTQGHFQKGILQAHLNTKLLNIDKTEIKNIDIEVKGPLDKLDARLQLQTPFANVQRADISLEELSKISVDANITTPHTSDEIIVHSDLMYTKELTTLELNASSTEFTVHIPKASLKEEKIDGGYRAVIQPKLSGFKNRLHLDGNFSYDETFMTQLKSKDLGGKFTASLEGDKVKLRGRKLSLQKLLVDLYQPAYAEGAFDLNAKGNLENIDFKINAKRLTLNKEETGVDENLSVILAGKLSTKELIVKPRISNRYLDVNGGSITLQLADKKMKLNLPLKLKKEKRGIDLILLSQAELQKDIQADISLSHKDDSLSFKNMSYKNNILKSDITFHMKDLSVYNGISGQELYGPLDVTGEVKYAKVPEVLLRSSTLGGVTKVSLKDNDLHLNFDRISAVKIGRLFKGKRKGLASQGNVGGTIDYNLAKKIGKTRLMGSDIKLSGIDIDKSMKEYQDMLGLNVYAVGKGLFQKRRSRNDDVNLTTKVNHLQLDLDITPELIISKDVAMATESFRFAVNTALQRDGEIKDFEIAILDRQGCAVLIQKMSGNIASPQLVDSRGTAVAVIGRAPQEIVNTGGKILKAGANIVDSGVNLLWQKALRQDSNVTVVNNTMVKGYNVLSSGKDMVVSGECKVFYNGVVQHPK